MICDLMGQVCHWSPTSARKKETVYRTASISSSNLPGSLRGRQSSSKPDVHSLLIVLRPVFWVLNKYYFILRMLLDCWILLAWLLEGTQLQGLNQRHVRWGNHTFRPQHNFESENGIAPQFHPERWDGSRPVPLLGCTPQSRKVQSWVYFFQSIIYFPKINPVSEKAETFHSFGLKFFLRKKKNIW